MAISPVQINGPDDPFGFGGAPNFDPTHNISGTPAQSALVQPTFPVNGDDIFGFEGDPTAPALQQLLAGINLDTRGLQALRQEGLRQGPSRFAQLAKQQQLLEEGQGIENLRQSGASQLANASGNLAARGGLSSGARERLQGSALSSGLLGEQQQRRAGQAQRLGILGADEQSRLDILKQLPGQELAALNPAFQKATLGAQAAQFDASQLFAQQQAEFQAQLQKFQTEGEIFGAERQARVEEKENEGCFVCAQLKKRNLMTRKERYLMSKLMIGSFFYRLPFFVWYGKELPKTIEMANEQGIDWLEVKKDFVDATLKALKEGGRDAAETVYGEASRDFVLRFRPEHKGFKESFRRRGFFSSLWALPKFFSIPGWKVMVRRYITNLRKVRVERNEAF